MHEVTVTFSNGNVIKYNVFNGYKVDGNVIILSIQSGKKDIIIPLYNVVEIESIRK